jgi:peptide/nickel transport system ATP-binding protein
LLFDTIPDLDLFGRRRQPVTGEVPNPINPPSGCAFHPRCPAAADRCRVEIPNPKSFQESLVACHAVGEGRLP